MAASKYLNSALRALTSQLRLKGGVTVETLAATYTFDAESPNIGYFDANGSDRNMQLPTEEASEGFIGTYHNVGSTGNLVFLNDAAGTVATVAPGQSLVLGCDGAAWGSAVVASVGSASGVAIPSGGAVNFGGGDVVMTSDGTDVDVTGTGKLDLRDDVAYFVDPAAPTKRVRIDAGTVTAGQTRVLAMPDADVTLPAAGVQPLATALTALSAGTAAVIGPVSSPMTAAQVLTNGNTVTLPTTGESKALSSASAVTGIILTAGSVSGQKVTLMNTNAADSITFDGTPATSNIAQAVHLIAAGTSKVYTWNPTAARWFPAG